MDYLRASMLDIAIVCEGQGSERFKLERVYRIAATALAMSAGTAETVQPAQGDSPPAWAEGNAQNKDRDHD